MDSTKIKVGKRRRRVGSIEFKPAMQAPTTPNASQQQTRRKPSPRRKPGIGKPSGSK
jgi:hypothetical protein